MGSAGDFSATLKGERYNCRARGPHGSDFCSPCRCCCRPVCLFVFLLVFLDLLNASASAVHRPSAFPSGLLQTMQRGKRGSRTWQIPLYLFTNSENAFHMARRVKTCLIYYTPTPLQSHEQFGSSVYLVPMRSPVYDISLPMTRRNTALNGQTS